MDKIINTNNYLSMNNNINNSGIIGGECSIIKNSNNDDNLDDILEGNDISTIIKRESTLNNFFIPDSNVEENNSFNNSLEINNNEPSLELVDYIFNISFNNELNNVQGGYLVKIVTSLIHSLYSPNKALCFIKYICFKKSNEILLKMLNLIQYNYFREIILEILLFQEEDNRDGILEIIKGNILNYLVNYLKFNGAEIKDLFCQFIECNKNEDIILTETFLSKILNAFNNVNNEKTIENFCIVNSYIIKSYKTEFNMNNNISTSKINMSFKSPMKLNNERSNFYFNSSVNLNFDEGNTLINKMTQFTKEINLNLVKSFSCIQSVLTFISDIISISRNNELLDNLKKINFFNFFSQKFFNTKNDIIQNILVGIINLLTEENNENWIINILIKNNFLKECVILSNNINIPSNIFVHLANLFELLVNNNYIKEVLSKNNINQEVNKIYQKIYKDYCDKMKKPLGDFKNNSFCLGSLLSKTIEGDNEFKKVDELDQGEHIFDNKTIKTMIDNTRNNSILKKNSTDLGNIANYENDRIENREDIDDDNTENKIIQIIPIMDDNNDE